MSLSMPFLPPFIQPILGSPSLRAGTEFAVAVACALLCSAAPSAPAQTLIVLNAGNTVSTLAGNGKDAITTAGLASTTGLGHPRGVVYDAAGNLYVADSRNHQVSRISSDGQLTIIAGTGTEGFSGDGGPGQSAQLSHPSALAVRADGTLLICDTGNHRVRSVSSTGVISTLAGTGAPGNGGDGGPAVSATLRHPAGIAVDVTGNVLLADTGNHRIRRIDSAGVITAVAGTGEEGDGGDGGPAILATFRAPSALLPLRDERILIADTVARRIRILQADGSVAAYGRGLKLGRPDGLAVGIAGDVLLSDEALQRLFQMSADSADLLAGNGSQGHIASGTALASPLDSPAAIATAADGSTVIADRRNHQVQRLSLPLMDFGSVPAGDQSSSQSLTLQNGGQNALQVLSLTFPPAFTRDTSGTCTSTPVRLLPGQSCTVTLRFQPVAQGAVSAFATVTTDNTPPATLHLTGNAIPPTMLAASRTSLASNGTIAYAGAPVQLTAAVSGTLAAVPVGNVTFSDGTSVLSTLALTSATATYSTTALSSGPHSLQASYSGDAHYGASNSVPVIVTVVLPPDFTLSSSAPSYTSNAATTVSVPLTCTPQSGTLNHAVSFSVSGLPSGFTAVFAPSLLTLAANPAASTLTITVPATLAANTSHVRILWAGMLLLLPSATFRRRKISAIATLTLSIALSGCGGGFRAASTTGSSSTHRYNLTVTATTTGVLGDPLVHSIPIELVITP